MNQPPLSPQSPPLHNLHFSVQIFKCRIKLFLFLRDIFMSCSQQVALSSRVLLSVLGQTQFILFISPLCQGQSPDSLCTCLISGQAEVFKVPSLCTAQSDAWHPPPLQATSALPRIPGDEKLSCCAHIWNLSDDKIINVEANIVSDILSQPWELSQSQFLILKAQE